MVERQVTIPNPSGLHARPASKVVEFVKGYQGSVEIIHGHTTGNLKSILNLLSMGLKQGTEVTLRVSGKDEVAFIGQLAQLISTLEG